jgi:diketogulonate reductase-like aldo/keto reductase
MSLTTKTTTQSTEGEPLLQLSEGVTIPQLAFGLYLVKDEQCDKVICNAVKAGYRHFDSASFYGNEKAVGIALQKCGVPRSELFICSKVWNDAQKEGRAAVRQSFEQSVKYLQCDYLDLYLVHWPVPGHHVETYKELELLHKEGKIKCIGLSNYDEADYEELTEAENHITVFPVVNQLEVSPAMYRPDLIRYFQQRNIVVASFKSLNRGGAMDRDVIVELSDKYGVSPAHVMLRWNFQHGLVVISKTSNLERMQQNRNIFHFSISAEDMKSLDAITTYEDIVERRELEKRRKMNA